MSSLIIILVYLVVLFSSQNVFGSLGDVFPIYKDCREECQIERCESGGIEFLDSKQYSPMVRLLWSCSENCKYECMWVTVASFKKKGWPPPQFHGKWPFIRLFGIQEPASMIFSLMNLAMHARMFKRFLEEVRMGSPMFFLWCIYALVCFNAWFWSTVFHTRDVFFTETMDYLSAFSMIFYSIYLIGMRALLGKKKVHSVILTAACIYLFSQHALYLVVGGFDYKYNLMANIAAGGVSACIVAGWCMIRWREAPHARLIAFTVALCGVTTLLEVAEFPPYLWILDAHALWHFSTIPIPYFFWRDCPVGFADSCTCKILLLI